jgi:release factor glutamine methyltransferase
MSTAAATVSIERALAQIAGQLGASGIEQPRREARLLVAAALGWEVQQVWNRPESVLDDTVMAGLQALATRRSAREPLSRILGHREFWSLRFGLSQATLDPRPDSETLIEAMLAALPDHTRPYRLLDFGTGTGCLLLAALSELPRATGVGVDRAVAAVALARRNAAALGMADRACFIAADWGRPLSGQWDVILANPPYVPSNEVGSLMPEVAGYDPALALDGGSDGLDAYRQLCPEISRLLAPGGLAFLELGAGQLAEVTAIMRRPGLAVRGVRPDLSGIDRCIILIKS